MYSLNVSQHSYSNPICLQMCSASEAVKLLLEQLNSTLSFKTGDKVAVLINNLGGSSQIEQWIIAREVYNQLGKYSFNCIYVCWFHLNNENNLLRYQNSNYLIVSCM